MPAEFLDVERYTAQIIEIARQHPEMSRVRYRVNNGEWQWAKGVDFLALWDQPIAGTIYIDHVAVEGPER